MARSGAEEMLKVSKMGGRTSAEALLLIPHPLGGILRVTAPRTRHMRQSWEFFGFADDVADPFADLSI
jgi:hypothetical protein